MDFERRCWARIDLDALKNNFEFVKSVVHPTPVMAVVKADAYGHGAKKVSQLFQSLGVAWFGVSGLQEALELRRCGIEKNILILGYTAPEYAKIIADNNIIQTVNTAEYGAELSQAAVRENVTIDVHIKVDTGMGRLGFKAGASAESAALEVANVCALSNFNVCGIYTHFAVADSCEEDDIEYTKMQYRQLQNIINKLAALGRAFGTVHCCNSAGLLMSQTLHLDMVRAGIVLYGEAPSHDLDQKQLQPAVQLKAVISQVKFVEKGECLSYGRTFRAQKAMKVATISAGYADGYPRLMSNRGTVSINGKCARVVGRVCMDQMLADVSEIDDVKVGDIATLYGDGIADSATRIADITGTINYEILTGIGHRVPRVYVENGEEIEISDYLGE